MRKLHVVFVILTLALSVSCGKDSKKSSGGREFNLMSGESPVPSSYTGTIDVRSNILNVAGSQFRPQAAQACQTGGTMYGGSMYGGQYGGQYSTQSGNYIDCQSHQALAQLYSQLQYQPYAYRQVSQYVYRIKMQGYIARIGNMRTFVITSQISPY